MTLMDASLIPDAGSRRVQLDRDVRIGLRDGVSLAADLYLPVDALAAPVPVILELTPYHKRTIGDASLPTGAARALRHAYFASHGYAVLVVDARGTGDSEGINEGPSSPLEGDDIVEVIGWAAAQPWSSGAVGMIGLSYTAGTCYEAARRAPAALKAIVALQMASNWDTGVLRPGGALRAFVFESYGPLATAYGLAPPDPRRFPDWRERWAERLERTEPWCSTFVQRLGDRAFWSERLLAGHEQHVKAAVMLIGGWADWYPTEMLESFSRLTGPRRIIVGPWTHNYPESAWPEPRVDDRFECRRWFDLYLKGVHTDPGRPVDEEPRVTLFVRRFDPPFALRTQVSGEFAGLADWPPPRAAAALLYPGAGGRLHASPPGPGRGVLPFSLGAGVASGRYVSGQFQPGWGMPDDQRSEEPFSLVFTAGALGPEGLTIVGSPVAELELEPVTEATLVAVKLCDVHPTGASVLICNGLARLMPHGSTSLRIELRAVAYRLEAGHRLRLMVSSTDFQNCLPLPGSTDLAVHFGRSSLALPTAPLGRGSVFRPSAHPIPPLEAVPVPSWEVRLSPLRRSAGVDFAVRAGIGLNRSRYRITTTGSRVGARIQASYEYRLDVPGTRVLVRSDCLTVAQRTRLHHRTAVKIELNGEAHWSRRWVDSVKRPDLGE